MTAAGDPPEYQSLSRSKRLTAGCALMCVDVR